MSLAATCALDAPDSLPQAEAPDLRQTAGREAFAATLGLRHAGPRRVQIRYEWQGPEDAPLVVVAGGISAHRHVG